MGGRKKENCCIDTLNQFTIFYFSHLYAEITLRCGTEEKHKSIYILRLL